MYLGYELAPPEVLDAVQRLKSGKAPGPDGMRTGCIAATESLHSLFCQIWEERVLSQELKDTS